MKSREAILRSRWVRPFAHYFAHPSLWHLNRRSVPRGLAVGLFAAFALPVGQFALAALLAIPLRANVPLAAAATLVSNPITFAPIYIGAYKLGSFMLRHSPSGALVIWPQALGQQSFKSLVLQLWASSSSRRSAQSQASPPRPPGGATGCSVAGRGEKLESLAVEQRYPRRQHIAGLPFALAQLPPLGVLPW
jgi:uncharacterized protein (DUF2062 family)